MKPSIALVTARAARGLDEDREPLEQALRLAGATVARVAWDEPLTDWGAFDAAVLRSTWDYTDRLGEFRQWVARAAAATTVLNPASVVRCIPTSITCWRCGVPTVPAAFIEPGRRADWVLEEFLRTSELEELVGAGSRDTQRYKTIARAAVLAHAQRLLDQSGCPAAAVSAQRGRAGRVGPDLLRKSLQSRHPQAAHARQSRPPSPRRCEGRRRQVGLVRAGTHHAAGGDAGGNRRRQQRARGRARRNTSLRTRRPAAPGAWAKNIDGPVSSSSSNTGWSAASRIRLPDSRWRYCTLDAAAGR